MVNTLIFSVFLMSSTPKSCKNVSLPEKLIHKTNFITDLGCLLSMNYPKVSCNSVSIYCRIHVDHNLTTNNYSTW